MNQEYPLEMEDQTNESFLPPSIEDFDANFVDKELPENPLLVTGQIVSIILENTNGKLPPQEFLDVLPKRIVEQIKQKVVTSIQLVHMIEQTGMNDQSNKSLLPPPIEDFDRSCIDKELPKNGLLLTGDVIEAILDLAEEKPLSPSTSSPKPLPESSEPFTPANLIQNAKKKPSLLKPKPLRAISKSLTNPIPSAKKKKEPKERAKEWRKDMKILRNEYPRLKKELDESKNRQLQMEMTIEKQRKEIDFLRKSLLQANVPYSLKTYPF